MRICALLGSTSALLLLASCGGADQAPTGSTGTLSAEGFCNVEGLATPLRQTFILIDAAAITKAASPEEFLATNAWLRDAVLAIADPEQAIASGASVPRERIVVVNIPANGSTGTRMFTGCIPAMSTEEIAASKQSSSAVSTFFRGGVQEALRDQVESFRTRLVAALQNAAKAGEAGVDLTAPLPQRGIIAGVRNSAGLLDHGSDIGRLVLITDLANAPIPAEDENAARVAGFDAGQSAGQHLQGAEIVIAEKSGGMPAHKPYLDAFFLAQQARLVYNGGPKIGVLPSAPVRIARYVGQASYPGWNAEVEVRIGVDTKGRLAASWMTLRDRGDRSVPMAGRADCTGPRCEIRSSDDGFAQVWSLAPGGEPEFSANMPFGGLRQFELNSTEAAITGKLFDPQVGQIGTTPGTRSVSINAAAKPKAMF